MNQVKVLPRPGVLVAVALALGLWALNAAGQQHRLDPAQVKGPDACGECHEKSILAWRETHHSKTFKDLPRNDKAREIADKLGVKRIKNDSQCVSCHFTSAMVKGETEPQAIAGITCESCHGAGLGYMGVHSDFGGKDVQFGAPATKNGRAAKAFIEKRGGRFELWYEPEDGTHGTFMNTPKMVEEALDLWLK